METHNNNDFHDEEGTYRDSVATITKEGKRNYLNPKKPSGKLYRLRTIFSFIYLALFFTLPFLKINEEPIFLFNILERKFIFFGMIFWPQDFFLFGLGMLTFVVFIILFTVVFGRIFCGWACPQTIFMEMVFRKIEYWIDGDFNNQRKLRSMPWNAEKIIKRSIKFIIFFSISFIIANFFLAYLIGMDQLLSYVTHPGDNTGTLISLLIFTCVFFFVYWWFREQVCLVVCPYGRLQGVLLDKNSIVVAYDHVRGEPRGKAHKNEDESETNKRGDCIDCFACVRVCPTGIDIRNGTQLECVNCTACIDACNDIMHAVHKEPDLIKYASENSIQENKKLVFNTRIKAYVFVLMLLISVLGFLLVSRTDIDVRLMRTAGMAYTNLPDGRISNLYNLKLTNKTHKDIPYQIKLENIKGEIQIIGGNDMILKKEDYNHCQFMIKLGRDQLKSWKTEIKIGLYEKDKKIKLLSAKFIGPEVYN